MRSVLAGTAIALALLATPALAAPAKKARAKPVAAAAKAPSLYQRLGGQPAVSAVVDDFAGRVLADARINKKFARSDPARLVANLKDFVCSATGGPCVYKGLSMKESHDDMGVTAGEFGALVEDLVATLDKFKVPAKEKGELLAALGPLAGDIVEVDSPATGTALPADFDPAPPLMAAAHDAHHD